MFTFSHLEEAFIQSDSEMRHHNYNNKDTDEWYCWWLSESFFQLIKQNAEGYTHSTHKTVVLNRPLVKWIFFGVIECAGELEKCFIYSLKSPADHVLMFSSSETGSRWGSGPNTRPLHQPNRHDAGHHGSQPVLLQCQTDDGEGWTRAHAVKTLHHSFVSEERKKEAKLEVKFERDHHLQSLSHYTPSVSIRNWFPAFTNHEKGLLGVLSL